MPLSKRGLLLSYGLRCGLASGLASLLLLLHGRSAVARAAFAGPLFAPVFAAVACAPPHLGSAAKSALHVFLGWAGGALVSAAALAVAQSPHHASSNGTTYAVLVVLSLLVLLPDLPPLIPKMARMLAPAPQALPRASRADCSHATAPPRPPMEKPIDKLIEKPVKTIDACLRA